MKLLVLLAVFLAGGLFRYMSALPLGDPVGDELYVDNESDFYLENDLDFEDKLDLVTTEPTDKSLIMGHAVINNTSYFARAVPVPSSFTEKILGVINRPEFYEVYNILQNLFDMLRVPKSPGPITVYLYDHDVAKLMFEMASESLSVWIWSTQEGSKIVKLMSPIWERFLKTQGVTVDDTTGEDKLARHVRAIWDHPMFEGKRTILIQMTKKFRNMVEVFDKVWDHVEYGVGAAQHITDATERFLEGQMNEIFYHDIASALKTLPETIPMGPEERVEGSWFTNLVFQVFSMIPELSDVMESVTSMHILDERLLNVDVKEVLYRMGISSFEPLAKPYFQDGLYLLGMEENDAEKIIHNTYIHFEDFIYQIFVTPQGFYFDIMTDTAFNLGKQMFQEEACMEKAMCIIPPFKHHLGDLGLMAYGIGAFSWSASWFGINPLTERILSALYSLTGDVRDCEVFYCHFF